MLNIWELGGGARQEKKEEGNWLGKKNTDHQLIDQKECSVGMKRKMGWKVQVRQRLA
jgi:hypothetical protein